MIPYRLKLLQAWVLSGTEAVKSCGGFAHTGMAKISRFGLYTRCGNFRPRLNKEFVQRFVVSAVGGLIPKFFSIYTCWLCAKNRE